MKKICSIVRYLSMCDSIALHNNLTDHIIIVDNETDKIENPDITKKVNRLADLNKERKLIIEDLENEWKKHPKFDKAMFMGFQR